MNFLDACKKTVKRCGMTGSGPVTVENQSGEMALAVEWVRDAYLEVCGKWLNWKFLWAQHSGEITPGQSIYPPPSDLGIWDHSTIRVDGAKAEVLEYEAIKDWWEPSTNNGVPSLVVILPDSSLRLDPAPSGALSVSGDYYRVAPAPESNTDEFLIPQPYQNVILGRAMMLYAGYENAPDVKQDGLELYQQMMAQLEAHQLPNDGYRNGVSSGGANIVVRPV
ncbi:hypothetical protein [Pontibacterium sp.]|uniref:phage adaptor protein n=1 Tax=Pontibacterium sp. TaxID=2036026 RepID=UPI003564053C